MPRRRARDEQVDDFDFIRFHCVDERVAGASSVWIEACRDDRLDHRRKKFSSGGRVGGMFDEDPLRIAMSHPAPENSVNVNAGSGVRSPLGAAITTRNVALMTYLEEHGATEKGR
jgi:hypothetical protein